MQPLTVA
jgi:hypothetical protein